MTSGTPEGSQISPLLFAMFINDLPQHVSTNCLLYADDVKLYHRISTASDVDSLRADLRRLEQWSATWRLQLNASKCRSFSISLKRSPIRNEYFIFNDALEHVESIRDLGIILDSKLTFQHHVDNIICKANRALGVMMRSFQSGRGTRFDRTALIAAYCANVRSVLEFCSVVWGGAAKSHTDRIERVQHKFLMWLSAHIYGAPQNLEYSRLLSYFSLCSLSARRTQHDLVFLARIFKSQIDSSLLRSYFGLAAPSRPTRQFALFAVPYARVETIRMGLFCRLPKVMNEFLRHCIRVDIFDDSLHFIKSNIKKYVKTVLTARV